VIQFSSTATRATIAATQGNAAVATEAQAGGFAAALAALRLPGGDATTAPAVPDRQIAAEGGKILPAGERGDEGQPSGAEGDADDAEDHADPAFAWFGMTTPPPQPTTLGLAMPVPAGSARIANDSTTVPAPDVAAVAGAKAEAGNPTTTPAEASPAIAKSDDPAKAAIPIPAAQPAEDAPLVVPMLAPRPDAAPAEPVPGAPARRTLRDVTSLAGATAPTTDIGTTTATAVAAPAAAQQAALDTRRHDWTGAMVEQIEALRDNGPAGETRLRLAPDGLGTVDVAIRNDGDRVHVHFTTETQAARQLLSDAQPRLAELAEARGIRLGETSVASGDAALGQQTAQQQQQPQQHAGARATRPASAIRLPDAAETASDQRIA
jgi:flagellar hook-length control protein FliK